MDRMLLVLALWLLLPLTTGQSGPPLRMTKRCLPTKRDGSSSKGTVRIMYFDWFSSKMYNTVAGIILSDLLGYDVEMVPEADPVQVCSPLVPPSIPFCANRSSLAGSPAPRLTRQRPTNGLCAAAAAAAPRGFHGERKVKERSLAIGGWRFANGGWCFSDCSWRLTDVRQTNVYFWFFWFGKVLALPSFPFSFLRSLPRFAPGYRSTSACTRAMRT